MGCQESLLSKFGLFSLHLRKQGKEEQVNFEGALRLEHNEALPLIARAAPSDGLPQASSCIHLRATLQERPAYGHLPYIEQPRYMSGPDSLRVRLQSSTNFVV